MLVQWKYIPVNIYLYTPEQYVYVPLCMCTYVQCCGTVRFTLDSGSDSSSGFQNFFYGTGSYQQGIPNPLNSKDILVYKSNHILKLQIYGTGT
jgi:hypothetical protein